MPIIKSAKKRVRVAAKATTRNKKTKRNLRDALKHFLGKHDAASQHNAQSAIDIAVKKGVMHKNKAARLKRQLVTKAKAAGVKTSATKKPKTVVVTTKKTANKRTIKAVAPKKSTASKKTVS